MAAWSELRPPRAKAAEAFSHAAYSWDGVDLLDIDGAAGYAAPAPAAAEPSVDLLGLG